MNTISQWVHVGYWPISNLSRFQPKLKEFILNLRYQLICTFLRYRLHLYAKTRITNVQLLTVCEIDTMTDNLYWSTKDNFTSYIQQIPLIFQGTTSF